MRDPISLQQAQKTSAVHLISSLVEISRIDKHQQKPTEISASLPSSLSMTAGCYQYN
jgi:hypothetical protein